MGSGLLVVKSGFILFIKSYQFPLQINTLEREREREIHSKFYEGQKIIPSCRPAIVGASGGLSPQDGIPQQQEAAPLCIPQINRLIEDSFVQDESSVSNADVTVIPSQHRVTQQILGHWQPFQDLA
jgi:hypothetical protein